MGSRRSAHHRVKSDGIGVLHVINLILLVIFGILAAGLVFFMYRYHFLGFRSINHIVTGTALLVFLLSVGFILTKKAKVFTLILLLMALVGSSLGAYALSSALSFSAKTQQQSGHLEYKMGIVVLKDSPIKDVSELTKLSAPLNNDKTNIDLLIEEVRNQKGVDLSPEVVDSYLTAYQQLLSGQTPAIVINSAFHDILLTEDADYVSKIKTIYTYTAKQEVQAASAAPTTPQDSFNVYISGIDTYGDVSTVSRSDVNIIMTVNRTTKKVLLTTTPRDSYVPIADGGNNQYDKLTHAGIYGVDASVHTLENLYGIDISYYVRLNFTSFLKLIDLVGGITVGNDQAFSAGGHDFPVGSLTLNSEKALVFVRERYSLEGGDNSRGKNQTKVVAALVDKLTSASALGNVQGILDGLGNAIQTNASLEVINSLVNDQLGSGSQYSVTTQALEGQGTTGVKPSYAMPSAALYMFEISPDSLTSAKTNIQNTMEGK